MINGAIEIAADETMRENERFRVRLPDADNDVLVAAGKPSHAMVAAGPAVPDDIESLLSDLDPILRTRVTRSLQDLSIDPNNASLLNNAGMGYLTVGRLDEALSYFRRAAEADPAFLRARLNAVRCLLAKGQGEDALDYCQKLNAEFPNHPQALAELGRIYGQLGRASEAIAALDQAIERQPRNAAVVYERGVMRILDQDISKAISDFRTVVNLDPRSAAAHNALGVCFLARGSVDKAIRSMRVALELDKGRPEPRTNLATAYMKAGRTLEAAQLLEGALALFSLDSHATELLAQAYHRLGKHEASVRLLRQVLSRFEDEDGDKRTLARLHNNMGIALASLGQLESAEKHHQESLELNDETPVAFHNLARVYLRQGKLNQAKALLARYGNRFGDGVTVAIAGQVARRTGDYSRALELFERAIQLEPDEPGAYAALSALVADWSSDHSKAIEVLQQGLRRVPNHPVLLNNLAYSLLMAGEISRARRVLDRILGLQDNVFVCATRGLLLIREGNLAEGSRLYNRAAELASDAGLKALARQKKNLEVARYWKERNQPDKALRYATMAAEIKAPEPFYAAEASSMVEELKRSDARGV